MDTWKIKLVLLIAAVFSSMSWWSDVVGRWLAGLYGIEPADGLMPFALTFIMSAKLLYALYFAESFRREEIPYPFNVFHLALEDLVTITWGSIFLCTGLGGYLFAGAINDGLFGNGRTGLLAWSTGALLWSSVGLPLAWIGCLGLRPSLHALKGWNAMRMRIAELEAQLRDQPAKADAYREALEIFGFTDRFTREELAARHRELQKRVHPDTGGSPYFARRLNEAYELLKARRG